ncbi:hypothetical protein niasHS_012348 [Heterodera schachtii]|uniref:Peptidase M41 domain-containing protein n=1 Tax=Heterodera schachtii TaxID=97005 RepID=A0ABD2IMD5_HETSC
MGRRTLKEQQKQQQVTVVPVNGFDGATWTETRENYTKKKLKAELACLMGGKVAERMFFDQSIGHIGSDRKEAKKLAMKIAGYIGTLSKKQSRKIRRMLSEAEEKAKEVLKPRRRLTEKLAIKLFDRETLQYDDVQRILGASPASQFHVPQTRNSRRYESESEGEYEYEGDEEDERRRAIH